VFIGNVTAALVASIVWSAATRTLTADPATDAGAATFVWTHATRTLTADPFTDATGGVAVWTHATRTLTADPATDAGAATLVWAHSTRTITGFGAALTQSSVSFSSLANNGTIDLRAPGSTAIDVTVAVAAAVNMVVNLFDGTSTLILAGNNVAGSTGFSSVGGTSSVGLQIKNTNGSAQNYMYTVAVWHI
jgi:hypothetical protein